MKAKWIGQVEAMADEIGQMIEAVSGKIDNASEKWLESEKGEAMSALLDSLEAAKDALESVEWPEGGAA